jgi:hypothetical protein
MDNFEQGTLPQKQKDLVEAVCWDCGTKKLCFEFIVCCTGTRFHTCRECERRIKESDD